MKFFLDTANIEEIREGATLGVVDGVTTNPSLIAKSGKSLEAVAQEIVDLVLRFARENVSWGYDRI